MGSGNDIRQSHAKCCRQLPERDHCLYLSFWIFAVVVTTAAHDKRYIHWVAVIYHWQRVLGNCHHDRRLQRQSMVYAPVELTKNHVSRALLRETPQTELIIQSFFPSASTVAALILRQLLALKRSQIKPTRACFSFEFFLLGAEFTFTSKQ